jgi:hypothetical protein
MFRNGLPGSVEIFGKGVGCHRLQCYQRNDRPSCRVGDGLENISSHFISLDLRNRSVASIKRNCSVSQVLFLFFQELKIRAEFLGLALGGFASKVLVPRPRSGLKENSPALQRWVTRWGPLESVKRTTEQAVNVNT